MSATRVIARKHLPTVLPFNTTLLLMLASDVWAWSPFWTGVTAAILAIIWIGALASVWRERDSTPEFVEDRPPMLHSARIVAEAMKVREGAAR